jgi:hypothetical protein
MSASDLRAKLDEVDGPRAGLAEAMGFPSSSSRIEAETDEVALDVLRRSHAALIQLGEDCDPQTIGVGLAACGRVIKQLQRRTQGEVNLALIATASLAPEYAIGEVAPQVLDDEVVGRIGWRRTREAEA